MAMLAFTERFRVDNGRGPWRPPWGSVFSVTSSHPPPPAPGGSTEGPPRSGWKMVVSVLRLHWWPSLFLSLPAFLQKGSTGHVL